MGLAGLWLSRSRAPLGFPGWKNARLKESMDPTDPSSPRWGQSNRARTPQRSPISPSVSTKLFRPGLCPNQTGHLFRIEWEVSFGDNKQGSSPVILSHVGPALLLHCFPPWSRWPGYLGWPVTGQLSWTNQSCYRDDCPQCSPAPGDSVLHHGTPRLRQRCM